jgi:hypothetical protein
MRWVIEDTNASQSVRILESAVDVPTILHSGAGYIL